MDHSFEKYRLWNFLLAFFALVIRLAIDFRYGFNFAGMFLSLGPWKLEWNLTYKLSQHVILLALWLSIFSSTKALTT